MPSNIQDATAAGSNLFDASVNQRRKNLAFNALQAAYGDVAGDPEAFGKLQATQERQDTAPARAESLRLGNQSVAEANDFAAEADPLKVQALKDTNTAKTGDIDAEAQKRKAQALLNGALFVKGAIGRGEDPGAAFDQIAPMLALDPAHAAQMRTNLVANPKSVDDFITALQDRDKKVPDPSAIQEDKYFQSLSPAGQARYLTVKRANQTSVTDVEGGKEVIIRNPDGTVRRVPLSTLGGEAAAAGTIKGAEAAGAATGKAAGEKAAEDLPNSKTGKIKAKVALDTAQQSADLAVNTIDKAVSEVGPFSAGASALTSFIGGTPAANLKSRITTITSKIVLDTISEMKRVAANGSTGLGALSDREGELIASRLGSVDQSQSPAQLRESLRSVKKQLQDSWARFERAYHDDLAARSQAQDVNDADLLKRYGIDK